MKLSCKYFPGTNTLAYFAVVLMTKTRESFATFKLLGHGKIFPTLLKVMQTTHYKAGSLVQFTTFKETCYGFFMTVLSPLDISTAFYSVSMGYTCSMKPEYFL
jgi:hypothetical protein